MSNTFGNKLKITTFGSSHGNAIGGVIDGFPQGIEVDFEEICRELQRRKTGNFAFSSQRKESDEVTFLSGIDEGMTNGFPIAFFIKNNNYRSRDYTDIKDVFRPSHADFAYFKKYGTDDFTGGYRASGRETTSWVVAGNLAKQALAKHGIGFVSYVSQIGQECETAHYTDLNLSFTPHNALPTPNPQTAERMLKAILQAQADNDSLGGVVTCIVTSVPYGVGNPIFDKLSSRLAAAMLSIPSSKGFDYGKGFDASSMRGSEHNDLFVNDHGKLRPATNRSGGIQGGISNGEDIYFRVAFKPVSSIGKPQQTVDIHGNNRTIAIGGRHDVCIVPRVLPVVESLAALVILDLML